MHDSANDNVKQVLAARPPRRPRSSGSIQVMRPIENRQPNRPLSSGSVKPEREKENNPSAMTERERLLGKFRLLDINGDGYIDREELMSVLQGLAPNHWTNIRVNHVLRTMGKSNDSRINYEEFVRWAQGLTEDPFQQAFYYSTGALEWIQMGRDSTKRDRQARARMVERGRPFTAPN